MWSRFSVRFVRQLTIVSIALFQFDLLLNTIESKPIVRFIQLASFDCSFQSKTIRSILIEIDKAFEWIRTSFFLFLLSPSPVLILHSSIELNAPIVSSSTI